MSVDYRYVEYKSKKCSFCSLDFTPYHPAETFCVECREQNSNWELSRLDPKKRLIRLCSMAKARAKIKEIAFDIDGEFLYHLWLENEGCCCLTGLKFELGKYGAKGQSHPQAPSIDRINSKLGYTRDNVRLITYHMNISLSDFGILEFEKLIQAYNAGVAI